MSYSLNSIFSLNFIYLKAKIKYKLNSVENDFAQDLFSNIRILMSYL